MRLALLPVRALSTASRLAPRCAFSASATVAAASGARVASVDELPSEQAVRVTFHDGVSAKFHKLWLRDHCRCPQCLHPETKQRQLDTASIPLDPPLKALTVTERGAVAISWTADVRGTACTASEFDAQWLRDHAYALDNVDQQQQYPHNHRVPTVTNRELWNKHTLELPVHSFDDCLGDIKPFMQDLYKFGLVKVSDTPSSMDETEKFATKIGFVLRTIYGTMWTTNPKSDSEGYNDTASTNLELLHHTDGTYIRDPPGLQIFNCVAQAGEGGESRYTDSFFVAETLKREDPEAFAFLAKTPLHYQTYDNDAHLATMEPILRLDYRGNITQFRHNDYDRAPLTHLSFEDVGVFYRAHRKLLEIMRRDEMEVETKLRVGEMIVVDNQRVMHGRHAFDGGERSLIGCYIGQTEYESRLRVLGII